MRMKGEVVITKNRAACALVASAIVSAVALSGVSANADPTVPNDPFSPHEVAFLNEVHRFSAAMGVNGDDESLVQDGT
jgi:hypothetical protein